MRNCGRGRPTSGWVVTLEKGSEEVRKGWTAEGSEGRCSNAESVFSHHHPVCPILCVSFCACRPDQGNLPSSSRCPTLLAVQLSGVELQDAAQKRPLGDARLAE